MFFKAASEGSQVPNHSQYPPSQTEQNLLRSDTSYDYEVSVNGQTLRSDYLDVHISQGLDARSVVPSSNEEGQVCSSRRATVYNTSHAIITVMCFTVMIHQNFLFRFSSQLTRDTQQAHNKRKG